MNDFTAERIRSRTTSRRIHGEIRHQAGQLRRNPCGAVGEIPQSFSGRDAETCEPLPWNRVYSVVSDPSFRLRAWLSRDRASLLRSSPYSRSRIRSEFLISNLKFLTAVGAAGKEVRRFFRGSPGVPSHFTVMRREPYFHYGFLGGKPERFKRRAGCKMN